MCATTQVSMGSSRLTPPSVAFSFGWHLSALVGTVVDCQRRRLPVSGLSEVGSFSHSRHASRPILVQRGDRRPICPLMQRRASQATWRFSLDQRCPDGLMGSRMLKAGDFYLGTAVTLRIADEDDRLALCFRICR
jgi:hypothetical protein